MEEMNRTVKALTKIEDGLHKGTIINVEQRITQEKYEYIDITIKMDDTNTQIKTSAPDSVSTESKLGKILQRFGADLIADKVIQIDKLLMNRTCQFQTMQDGQYSKVIDGSLKPVEPMVKTNDEIEAEKIYNKV